MADQGLAQIPGADLADQLELAALHSDLCAERAEVIANHFRPRFEAARTAPPEVERKGSADPLNFYSYVIDEEREVRRWRKDAEMMRAAATVVRARGEQA